MSGKSELKKRKCQSEHAEQREFVSWFRQNYPNILIFSIPNGAYLNGKTPRDRSIQANKLKLEGLVEGVPDLFIPALKIFIEMKALDGKLGRDQAEIRDYLELNGYKSYVCYGCEEAIECLKSLLL